MRRNLSLVLGLAMLLGSSVASAQLRFGAKAGLNLASVSVDPSEGSSPKNYTSFHVGITGDYMINQSFGIQTGLLYSMKGYVLEESTNGLTAKETLSQSYLEIPINSVYTHSIGDVKLIGFAGPYLALAVSGKIKSEMSYGGQSKSETADIDYDTMNRFDAGVNFGLGAEVSNVRLTAQYGLGLVNMYTGDSDITIKNRVVGVSLAYMFGGK